MPINTLTPKKELNFSNIVVYFLALLGIVFIVYFGGNVIKNIGNLKGKAAFQAISQYQEAEVLVNGKSIGVTPIQTDEITAGENKITLKTPSRQYDTTIQFFQNTQIVVNQDMGVSEMFSSGQNFWIEKSAAGTVLSITSEPNNAKVFIDETEIGTTPYSNSNLTTGEYDLRVEAPGYESHIARIKIQKGFNLNISLKLFPIPVPAKVNLMEGSENLYNVSTGTGSIYADVPSWVKSVIYWNKTRGINLAGTGINKEPVFDYYLDYKGDIYNKDGELIKDPADYEQLKNAERGAYLGRTSDGNGLSQAAKETLQNIGEIGTSGEKTVTIKQTGTGWLRVRDVAGLTGGEVARVDVGGSYKLLEEQEEWVKIMVSDTVQGWVSKTYVDISQ
ncbi:MAG: PEGA domain protein [candidate division WWE3 bacterium GW2011_GWB1_41_6]|uniref:PEGA domain protein n=1 Tax=candidate division WWE3 bacterium GW2011_GWB1_41_6 TaxID=1619112 RepID=A0A0G0WNT3_UNCKA|nr:MAG: PEGA domain protein [candidate division WWE3 bacterium GW2011_GWB1_41_6]